MTHQSPRQPADIIQAILKNLEWCADLSERAAKITLPLDQDMGGRAVVHGLQKEAGAYRQCIALVKSEAASLLTVTP